MKFIKSSLAKKLIIILVAIMIFNFVIPQRAEAARLIPWKTALGIVVAGKVAMGSDTGKDLLGNVAETLGGILLKPLTSLITLIVSTVNIGLGMFLYGVSAQMGKMVDVLKGGGNLEMINNTKISEADLFISPEDIFAGRIKLLDANLFERQNEVDAGGADMSDLLKDTAAKIYVILRNICALVMLAGLIYTGIRVLLSANIPSKKMQYLMLLEDWIVGMVLLIFSHIIMIGIFELSDAFTTMLGDSMDLSEYRNGITLHLARGSWNSGLSIVSQLAYLILYAYMTWLVIIFTISYFKRFFWLVVLTIFAPVCSIMYSFGQQTKQIYSRWIKEYIMTVLIQPFHMLVYYVLVLVPLSLMPAGSQYANTNKFAHLIYMLVAFSFIRPAEKYLRELFGFSNGIAGAGSYDSGAATFKAMAGAARNIGSIARTAIRGGRQPGASDDPNGGMNPNQPDGGAPLLGGGSDDYSLADAYNTAGLLGDGMGGSNVDDDGATLQPEDTDDYNFTDAMLTASALKNGSGEQSGNEDYDQIIANAKKEKARLSGKLGALTRKEKAIKGPIDQHFGTHEINGLESAYTEEQEEQLDDILKQRRLAREGIAEQDAIIARAQAGKEAQSIGEVQGSLSATGENGKAAGIGENSQISVGDLTINASNININGSGNMNSNVSGDTTSNVAGDSTSNASGNNSSNGSSSNKDNINEDENFEIDDEGKTKTNGKWRNYNPINWPINGMRAAHDLLDGKRSIADAVTWPYGKAFDKMSESKNGFIRKIGTGGQTVRDVARRFEAAGGFAEIYKGLHEIGDTMYVNGPPSDWKGTASRMDENRKRKEEITINNFMNNPKNKEFMLTGKGGPKLLEQYREIYKDKNPEYQRYKAEEEAKSKLQSMAKEFVPYGITDLHTVYNLSSDKKKYGYTAEEAIRQESNFNKFNYNSGNISTLNKAYGLEGSNTPVSVKIPDAREYFNRGINDISTMINADKIASALYDKLGDKLSKQMRRDISAAIAKKGGVSYNGNDENIRRVIEQITKKGI